MSGGKMATREETFYNGDYLEAFANLLVVNRHGKRRRNRNRDKYSFNHRNFDQLEIVITSEWLGLGSATSQEISLRGPRKQIRKFMEDADRTLENAVHSQESVAKQLLEVKRYENVLRRIAFSQVKDSIGRPFLMTSPPWNSDIPHWGHIGYLREIQLAEKSPWITGGFSLERLDSKSKAKRAVHEIDGVKYRGGGHPTYGESIVCEGERNNYFVIESDEFGELIERIEDSRPVVIT